jgi:hypothetical protein
MKVRFKDLSMSPSVCQSEGESARLRGYCQRADRTPTSAAIAAVVHTNTSSNSGDWPTVMDNVDYP